MLKTITPPQVRFDGLRNRVTNNGADFASWDPYNSHRIFALDDGRAMKSFFYTHKTFMIVSNDSDTFILQQNINNIYALKNIAYWPASV